MYHLKRPKNLFRVRQLHENDKRAVNCLANHPAPLLKYCNTGCSGDPPLTDQKAANHFPGSDSWDAAESFQRKLLRPGQNKDALWCNCFADKNPGAWKAQ